MHHRFTICLIVLALAMAGTAVAQTSGSNLTGRVIYQDGGMPGVTVTVSSAALQGVRTTTTNAQGDYILKSLPAGDYKVRFELTDFATLEHDVKMSTSQPRTLDAVIYPEAVQEEIVVTGSYETVSTGSQGSATVEHALLEKLPVLRNINSAVVLNAGTADTGPGRNPPGVSISGAQSYESLYTMNGVVLNENLRGGPFDLFIEDAILETTTITSSASAEYGRFSGGVVNVMTKTGGNEFSGSFRVNMTNEAWNGETPLTTSQEDKDNYVYEGTFGGYVLRDKLWFFLAGRDSDVTQSGQIFIPSGDGEQFPTARQETRYEGRLTGSITPNHRLAFYYVDREAKDINYYPSWAPPGDWAAVDPERTLPNVGWNINYTGVLTANFFVEGLYSEREFQFIGSGGDDTSIAGGTPVYDYFDYGNFNAPWFCGSCPPEERSNENTWVKASWFVSGAGTHDLVFGFDSFHDIRKADNWQSASGYALGPWTPQDYSTPGSPLLRFTMYDYIIWGAVLNTSQGNDFTTNSAFVNDTWRVNDKLTVNLGVRYDANDGTDQGGVKVVEDSRFSPRLSASYDLKGDGSIILTAGASRYVMSVANSIGDAGTDAGGEVWNVYWYDGPDINAGTPEYPTNHDAIEAIFDHFWNVYGGVTNTDMLAYAYVPGLTPKIGDSLRSPYGDELTLGASFRLGTRGVLRADWVYRDYGDFYVTNTVPNRWAENEEMGVIVDLGIYENRNQDLKRTYNALMTRFDYRIGSRWNIGANYTWSEAEGNIDGENSGSGPLTSGISSYEEYKDPSWNMPIGLLNTDQTHKFRAWVSWDAISNNRHNLNVSVMQSFSSGTPYGAFKGINTVPYVGELADLGYIGSGIGSPNYYFTDRGAFRTDNVLSTDLALNYSFFVNIGGGQLELFVQPEVTNIFNNDAVRYVNTTVVGPRQGMEAFNPFTETPVEGVNWEFGPSFGEPQRATDYQLPRTFRLSFGLRF